MEIWITWFHVGVFPITFMKLKRAVVLIDLCWSAVSQIYIYQFIKDQTV